MEKEKDLADSERELREADLHSLSQRALRMQKLDSLKIGFVPTLRVFDCVREAKHSYINGCFRGCIICCANAVEQSFLHELIFASDDWEKTYWEIRVNGKGFKYIIDTVEKNSKKNRRLKLAAAFIRDAHWLRRVRNEIAAHPTYVTDYTELKSSDELILANRMMFRDIRHLLQFLDPKEREYLESQKLTAKTPQGKVVKESEPLKAFMENPMKTDTAVYIEWWMFQGGLLSYLALEAYRRVNKVLNGLYSVKRDCE
jgi:hypothetical protein